MLNVALIVGSINLGLLASKKGFMAAAIGNYDAAFRHFEDGLEERSLVVSWLRDPMITGIQDDSRYAALMKRIGLTP